MNNIFNSFVLFQFPSVEEVGTTMLSVFYKILIILDSIVFYTIDVCYQVFLALSRARIFGDEFFSKFLSRSYVLIGVLMMFFIVYTLLKTIINPDEITKGNMAPGKIVSNILTSIIIVVLLPAIFNFIYRVQGVILDNDLLGRIIIGGSTSQDVQNSVKSGGRQIAVEVFSAFFYPDQVCDDDGKNCAQYNDEEVVTNYMNDEGNPYNLKNAKEDFINGKRSFTVFCDFTPNAARGEVHYSWFISTIAGGFCLYVMICFVFDVGIRAVKLGALQLIAPIPVLMRVIPNKDKTFNSWLSLTLSTFFEIFVRIFLIYMVASFAGQMSEIWNSMGSAFSGSEVTTAVKMMAKAFLLMGLIAFAKQAPKMISDLLGIKSGNMGLSLAQRMNAGGGFALGAAIGGGVTTFGRNATNAYRARRAEQEKNKQNRFRDKLGAGWSGLKSGIAGAASGAVRGGYYGTKAKSFGDMAGSARKGTEGAINARDRRNQFYNDNGATRNAVSGKVQNALNHVPGSGTKVGKAVTGALAGAAGRVSSFAVGHGKELKEGIASWWTGDNVETLRARKKKLSEAESVMKAPRDKAVEKFKEHPEEVVAKTQIGTDASGNPIMGYKTLSSIIDEVNAKKEKASQFDFLKTSEGIAATKAVEVAAEKLQIAEAKLSAGPPTQETIAEISKAQIELSSAQANFSAAEQKAEVIKSNYQLEARDAEIDLDKLIKSLAEQQISFQMEGRVEDLVHFNADDIKHSMNNDGTIDITKLTSSYKIEDKKDANGNVIIDSSGNTIKVVAGREAFTDSSGYTYDSKMASTNIAEVGELLDQMKSSFGKNSATISRNIQDYVRNIQNQMNGVSTVMQAEYQNQIDNLNALMQTIQNPSEWNAATSGGSIVKLKDKLKAFSQMNAALSAELARKEKEEQEKKEKKG